MPSRARHDAPNRLSSSSHARLQRAQIRSLRSSMHNRTVCAGKVQRRVLVFSRGQIDKWHGVGIGVAQSAVVVARFQAAYANNQVRARQSVQL